MGSTEQRTGLGVILLFGPPGAGKGTQARRIRDRFAIPYVSTGDLIRARMRGDDDSARALRASMAAGKFISDEWANELVRDWLHANDVSSGCVLDGYPRTAAQARVLRELVVPAGLAPVVIDLRVRYNAVMERLGARQMCAACGAIYNAVTRPPQQSDICDECHGRLIVRSDDQAEVVRDRLRTYERETVPVLAVFREAGDTIVAVDGNVEADGVSAQIFGVLERAA